MEILQRYVHGSADSTDVDVVYVVDVLPDAAECKKFCSEKEENRNVMTVADGIVTACYKGTPDELNNSLFRTYGLHEQTCPLIVTREVERIVPIKIVRAMRIILSHLSRSQFRPEIKEALRGSWRQRMRVLLTIISRMEEINFSTLNKNMTAEDIKKIIAFQTGQTLALINGRELFTKREIADEYPELELYLYRQKDSDVWNLKMAVNDLYSHLWATEVSSNDDTVISFPYWGYQVDLLTEKYNKIES